MTIEIDDVMMGGERLGPPMTPVRTYPARRVCAATGCKTVLSIYNSGSCCAVHDFRVELPADGRRIRAARHVVEGQSFRQAA